MAINELPVGTTVTRKQTGQIGQIMNVYSDNYIIELSDGDGYKHETRVVPLCAFKDEYKASAKTAGRVITAAEKDTYEREFNKWTTALPQYLVGLTEARSVIPVSDEAKAAITEFAADVAQGIATERSGEQFSGARQSVNEAQIRSRLSPAYKANETSYNQLMQRVKGTAAESMVQQEYEKQKAMLDKKREEMANRKHVVNPREYLDLNYLEQMATALWLEKDIYPRVRQMAANTAQEMGFDPEAALEQPVIIEDDVMKDASPDQRAALEPLKEHQLSERSKLAGVTAQLISKFKNSDEFKSMLRTLAPMPMVRLMNDMDVRSTPAEFLWGLANYVGRLASSPRTGLQTQHKRREPQYRSYMPKEHRFETQAPQLSEVLHPEFASVATTQEERQLLALYRNFVTAMGQADLKGAGKAMEQLKAVKASYQAKYSKLLNLANEERAKALTPELKQVQAELQQAMQAIQAGDAEWQQEAQKWNEENAPQAQKPEDKKPEGDGGNPKKAAMGIDVGQPVRYLDNPAVHFIVSYDDMNPTKMYLIAESDVNSHDRCELVEATVADVTPLKMWAVDIGDLVDAFGTTGRVVDASARDLGYVYAELRGNRDVVPVDLSSTALPWSYSAPTKLHVCATCGGHVTAGEDANCPFIGMPMPFKKGDSVPPTDAKADETKKAAIDLAAALEGLDVSTTFPADKPAVELYEDDQNQIKIGSTVHKFGSVVTGTVVGFKRNCCVVDWDGGASEACWKQELVLVTAQTDAY